jgi:hypothetical protein
MKYTQRNGIRWLQYFKLRLLLTSGARGYILGLRHYTTSRKVAASIPDEVIEFFLI